MKSINDICVVVMARKGSERVPNKMLKPFADTTLVDLVFSKLSSSRVIPKENIYLSAYEEDLKEVGRKYGVNIYDRSKESVESEGEQLSELFEWYNKLPFKYVILTSACNPLLKIETIDSFIEKFLTSDSEGSFAVFEKKTYYWDKEGKSITDWKGETRLNTKYVEPVYEAAHCLYASRMDIIGDNYWMDTKSPPEPELFVMDELEAFDIDYDWQFKVGEILYNVK
jgi:CMP-N-acetylneuraminic acid synthetase